MKYLTLIINSFMLLCNSVFAQNISVASFSLLENDLTANTTGTMVLDLNGEKCALIKVETTQTGFTFDVGTLGVVKTEQHTAEIWVYVPAGVKRITIAHQQLGRLNDYDLGMTLQRAKTYRLKLTTGMVETIVHEAKVKTGWLVIDSQPQGASVYLNEEYIGNTPVENYKTEYGTYQYRLELGNYHNATGIVELNQSRNEQTIALRPAFGSINVKSSVSGAQVLLDGQNTGKTTPCTLDLVPSGRHTVVVQMQRYSTVQQTIEVKDGENVAFEASLSPRFASVNIQSLLGASIYIDGSSVGSSSYTAELMEGYHDIEVNLAHHRKAEKQIKVEAGQNQSLTLEPTPIYGSLDVVSTPRNAQIIIDGKKYGVTPNSIEQLLEGTHSVELVLNGFQTEKTRVTIEEGKTATLSSTLKSGKTIETEKKSQSVSSATKSQQLSSTVSRNNAISARKSNNKNDIHFYAGIDYKVLMNSEVGLSIGLNLKGFVLEGNAMLGLTPSETIYISETWGDPWYAHCFGYSYKPLQLKGSIGWMIPIGSKFSITPMAGFGICQLNGTLAHVETGEKPSDYDPKYAYSYQAPVSLRFDYRFASHFGISVVPAYSICFLKDASGELYDVSSDIRSFMEGFNVRAGLNIYF